MVDPWRQERNPKEEPQGPQSPLSSLPPGGCLSPEQCLHSSGCQECAGPVVGDPAGGKRSPGCGRATALAQGCASNPGSESHAQCSSHQGDEATGDARASLQDALHNKSHLMAFILLKYITKERTTRVEMLELFTQDHQDHFPVIFSQASKGLHLIFGIYVNEVNPRGHTYVLVPTRGLTWDGVNEEQRQPKTSPLVLLLGIILLRRGRVSEGSWEMLSVMEVYPGKEHFIYGEPRELITRVCVKGQYLVYREVPTSYPACFELLWDPRAHSGTHKWQVLKFMLGLLSMAAHSFLSPSEEARSNEEWGP